MKSNLTYQQRKLQEMEQEYKESVFDLENFMKIQMEKKEQKELLMNQLKDLNI